MRDLLLYLALSLDFGVYSGFINIDWLISSESLLDDFYFYFVYTLFLLFDLLE